MKKLLCLVLAFLISSVAVASDNSCYSTKSRLAKVVYVVDGDTFDAVIDMGLGMSLSARVRVKDYDAPESTWRAKTDEEQALGLKAKEYVTTNYLNKSLVVNLLGYDVYARVLADVYQQDCAKFSTIMTNNGFVK